MRRLLVAGVVLAALLPMTAAARGGGGGGRGGGGGGGRGFGGRSTVVYGGYGGYGGYGSGYYGNYGPYGMYGSLGGYGGVYGGYGTTNAGRVKFDTKVKDAEVFIDGSYAGTAGQLKTITLKTGSYDIEVRTPGRTAFAQRIYVVGGKTLKLRPNL